MTAYAVTDWVSNIVGTMAEAIAEYETKLETLDITSGAIVISDILCLPRRGFQAYIIHLGA